MYRRKGAALEPGEVLEAVAEGLRVDVRAFRERRRNSPLRAVACRFLLKFAGLTQREVADLLGMGSGTAVSVQVKRYEDWLAADARLRRMAGKTERNLERKRRERSQATSMDP